ncbi:A disintegrin and metalloproteinase with thrombospondin motifs 9-like, partial [Asbolus verrucosus]
VIQDSFCMGILKPNETKLCKNSDCALTLPYQRPFDYGNDIITNSIISYDRGYRWITGAWSQCSKSCGSGVSSRMVVCRNDFGEENDHFCAHHIVPYHTIECNAHPCPNWEYGGWSDCDSNCEKRRQVTCRNSTGSFVEDSQCDKETKPSVMAKCKQCPRFSGDRFSSRRYRWTVGKWKRCSTTCGEGQKHRQVVCEDVKLKRTLVDQFCDHLPKPKTTSRCEKYGCPYVWIATPWSQCSADCGTGEQYRNVTCHRVYQKGSVDPIPLHFNKLHPNSYCNVYEKSADVAKCGGNHCNEAYVWRTEPWKECSHSCGKKGRRTRQIYCLEAKTGLKVEKRLCPKHSKPKRRVKCNQWRCLYKSCKEIQHHTKSKVNKDYLITIRNRPAWVYCYKMDTSQPEEYITLHADSQNYAENYDKRLRDPNSCPYDGRRFDACDCLEVGPERSGLTKFWKVRLNVTSLRIIGDDFTFSRQSRGMRVPYGTAGDCYSARKGCAQAKFSIDLTGTSFRLSENVRWRSIGKHATARIDASERRVVGQCGGYCGNCVADASVGLQVEIT